MGNRSRVTSLATLYKFTATFCSEQTYFALATALTGKTSQSPCNAVLLSPAKHQIPVKNL